MNFDVDNLFGGGFAKLSALEECENIWKNLRKNPTADESQFWVAADMAYNLLVPCLEEDVLPKELIGVFCVLHDFANDENAVKKAPVWAAIAEAISGFGAYSLVEIPLEDARSVRAFCEDYEYVVNFDKKEIIKE